MKGNIDFLYSLMKRSFRLKLKIIILIELIFLWLNKPKWLNRLTLYLLIYNLLIILSIFFFHNFGLFYNDPDSARYMLSALVQSEAAIIAIVITLSLVAVQLASQSYSARFIDIFKKTPDLWILVCIYIISMIHGLGVLKLIEARGFINQFNLENHISFSYFLGIFAFVSLIPYIWNTFNLLKPSTVMKLLSERITNQTILSAIGERKKNGNENDPILPIIDIIRSSLMKYDSETVIDGLNVIRDRYNQLIENKTIEKKEKEEISNHIFIHLTRIGNLAMSKEYYSIVVEVSNNLNKCSLIAATQELEESIIIALKFFGIIGKASFENESGNMTENLLESIRNIGKVAAEQELLWASSIAAYQLREVGKSAAEKKLRYETMFVLISLGYVGKVAAEKELNKTVDLIAISLGEIGNVAVKQTLEAEAFQAIILLREIGLLSSKNDAFPTRILSIDADVPPMTDTLRFLLWDSEILFKKYESSYFTAIFPNKKKEILELKELVYSKSKRYTAHPVTNQVVTSLGEIGISAAKQKLERVTLKAISSLYDLLTEVNKLKLNDVVLEIENYLNEIEKIAKK